MIGLLVRLLDENQSSLAFEPIELLLMFQVVFVLSLMTYLNKSASKAMDSFRPIMKVDEDQASLLRLYLTTMPARSINRLTVIFFLVYAMFGAVLVNYSSMPRFDGPVLLSVISITPGYIGFYTLGMTAILWLVNTIFIYNTVHQLKAISYAFTQCAVCNLFSQTELYAFTRVLAARSIGFILTSPLWLVLDPGIITLMVNILFSILALFIFFSPLLGVHRLLEGQKDILLKESSLKKEALIHLLFSRLEQGRLGETHEVGEALSDLSQAHQEIAAISTWPWQTHTIRQIAGAIALPIFIWLIQFFLSGWLGG